MKLLRCSNATPTPFWFSSALPNLLAMFLRSEMRLAGSTWTVEPGGGVDCRM